MKYVLYLMLAVIAFWCCGEDSTKHVVVLEHPEWSPTGNTIAIQKDEYDYQSNDGCDCEGSSANITRITKKLYLADTNGVVIKQLTGDSLNILLHEWSPSGTTLAFIAMYRGGLTVLGVVDSTHLAQILGYVHSSVEVIHWSPDGSEILYSQQIDELTQLKTRTISDNTTRTLFEDSSAVITSFNWSKSNKIAIALFKSPHDYIATMNADGSNYQLLDSTSVNKISQLTWSSDDSLLAYTYDVSSHQSQQVFYYNIYTNEKLQRTNFPAGRSRISGLRFSPDGKYISVVNSLGLYIIERMGPNAQQIVSGYADCSWSPDSRRIVYVVDNSLRFATIQ